MAEAGTIRMPIYRVMRGLTIDVEVTGLRVWRWRMWLARCMFHIGLWIMGTRGSVKAGDDG